MTDHDHPMAGRTVVITGASSGIGREAARALAARGAHVAVVGRDPARTAAVATLVGGRGFVADFDRLDDVRQLAAALLESYDRIDVLANNAGGLVPRRARTVDGYERTFQSNHLAPFLLTALLLPRLRASGARVISTASVVHRIGHLRRRSLDAGRLPGLGGWDAYGTSKLATLLFTEELARRTSLEAYAFHPGLVATNFGVGSPTLAFARLSGSAGIPAAAGAVPLVELASTPEVGAASGCYFDGLSPDGWRTRASRDPALAAALWEASAARVGIG